MSENPFICFIGVILVLMVAVLIVVGVTLGGAKQQCLAAGWPRAEMDYTLTQYCIKRVDQTDVVVPLSKITP
jgi:hypothetical protein